MAGVRNLASPVIPKLNWPLSRLPESQAKIDLVLLKVCEDGTDCKKEEANGIFFSSVNEK